MSSLVSSLKSFLQVVYDFCGYLLDLPRLFTDWLSSLPNFMASGIKMALSIIIFVVICRIIYVIKEVIF